MKKSIALLFSLISFQNLYALNIGDKLMNCEYNSDGTYDFCKAVTGELENIPSLKNRSDINLNYDITYNYSCSDNISQYIGVRSTSGNFAQFKYDETKLRITSAGKLSIVDINPYKTKSAQFVRDCNLHIKEIKADLTQETVSSLIKDACYMGVLNTQISQSQIIIYLAQSMMNNYGTLPINQLKMQLRNLQFGLQSISVQNNKKLSQQIQNIIGNSSTNDQVGTLNYILKNSSSWGVGSASLKNSLTILYSNLSTIMADISDTSRDSINKLYANGESITNSYNDFKSAKLPLEYLKYQYSLSRGEDSSKYKAPSCFNSP
ncbi:hypothetical protein GCL60_16490 [Silvanigrella paludirubra]|uniref:Uncharacterized protein n=1 Tax=Silvanigrella paludirubra TaxID=2499159 RepID=A0A6N6VP78_9BACT|nr:hypothetical protein [Silvanigrella paludirubra]KAB8035827.1 hypothetical protein GCL60_16490 [Silvanigrella paludirubra]